MKRSTRKFQVNLESLEEKALLSTLPVLTHNAFNQVLTQIDRAAGTYAKTHNATAFDAALAKISYKVPYGNANLFPVWQGDEGIYDPTMKGSGVQMVQQIKADLTSYVQSSVASGMFAVKGNWGTVFVATPTTPVAPVASTTTPVAPLLTHNTLNQVLKQIDRAAGTYARTHNAVAFDAALASISYKIPYGHSNLYFGYWQGDEGIYDPTMRGSGVQMVQQIKTDLMDYVHTSIADGTIRFR